MVSNQMDIIPTLKNLFREQQLLREKQQSNTFNFHEAEKSMNEANKSLEAFTKKQRTISDMLTCAQYKRQQMSEEGNRWEKYSEELRAEIAECRDVMAAEDDDFEDQLDSFEERIDSLADDFRLLSLDLNHTACSTIVPELLTEESKLIEIEIPAHGKTSEKLSEKLEQHRSNEATRRNRSFGLDDCQKLSILRDARKIRREYAKKIMEHQRERQQLNKIITAAICAGNLSQSQSLESSQVSQM